LSEKEKSCRSLRGIIQKELLEYKTMTTTPEGDFANSNVNLFYIRSETVEMNLLYEACKLIYDIKISSISSISEILVMV
jgi:hypothetical protein